MSAGSEKSGLAEEKGGVVPMSDEARLVLFWAGGRGARSTWVEKLANDVMWARRSVDAEEARAVARKSWTGDVRASFRYGRDLIPSHTPLHTFLDCTDVVLRVGEYLGAQSEGEGVAKACLCLGAYGGDRAMVEAASNVLCGTEGVAQRCLSVECLGRAVTWWAGAGGQEALFREVVWGVGEGVSGTDVSLSQHMAPDVVLSAVGGAAYGGLLDECRRGLEGLRGSRALWGKGVVEALLGAAGGGRLGVLEWALGLVEEEEGVDVNEARDTWGRTALDVATRNGHAQVVEMLVSRLGDRMDVSRRDAREGCAPLHWAALKGHASVVEKLVTLCGDRLDANAKDTWGRTALHSAALYGHVSVVEKLVSLCGDRLRVNAGDDEGRTALQKAAENGRDGVVERMVAMCGDRLDVNAKDWNGRTALHWAALNGHASVVEKLVALVGERLDVDAEDVGRMTALQWAARSGHASVVEILGRFLATKAKTA